MKALVSGLGLDASRASRIFLLAFPLALVGATIVFRLNPGMGVDELATTLSVPLMICYMLVRSILWLVGGAPNATPDDVRKLEKDGEAKSRPAMLAGLIFALGMLGLANVGLCWIVYQLLGLPWGAHASAIVLKVMLLVVASASVYLCLKLFSAWLIKIAIFLRSIVTPGPHVLIRLARGHR